MVSTVTAAIRSQDLLDGQGIAPGGGVEVEAQQQDRQRRLGDAAAAGAQHCRPQLAPGIADALQIAADQAGAGQQHEAGRVQELPERRVVAVAKAHGRRDARDRGRAPVR